MLSKVIFSFLHQDEHVVVCCHLLNLQYQLGSHINRLVTEFYSELVQRLPEHLKCSIMNLTRKQKGGIGIKQDTNITVSNICLASRDFTVKANGAGEGRLISMSLDSI